MHVAGLLTVDPKKRLTMDQLKRDSWLMRNNNSVFSEKTLLTPGVLTSTNNVQMQLTATMEAFHKATREGFTLQEVHKAPLAQRRKQKKGSDERSESTDSSHSSGSSTKLGSSQGLGSLGGRGDLSVEVTSAISGPSGVVPGVGPVLSGLGVNLEQGLKRNLSSTSSHSNTSSHSSTHSLGFVPGHRLTPVELLSSHSSASPLSTQDLFVVDVESSPSKNPLSFQAIRSSSESETGDDLPFQGQGHGSGRGVKRKHSLEGEDEDEFSGSDNDDDDDVEYVGSSDSFSDIGDSSDCILIESDDDDDGESNDEENVKHSDSHSDGNSSKSAKSMSSRNGGRKGGGPPPTKKPRPESGLVIDD